MSFWKEIEVSQVKKKKKAKDIILVRKEGNLALKINQEYNRIGLEAQHSHSSFYLQLCKHLAPIH